MWHFVFRIVCAQVQGYERKKGLLGADLEIQTGGALFKKTLFRGPLENSAYAVEHLIVFPLSVEKAFSILSS